jgi:glyoxylase-like metal-dependent hydrolase (beta-lactamase superfamily II)
MIAVGMLACNCSILGDAETGEAIVIDPGDEVERIQEILDRHQLRVRLIVSTHTHIDHVGGLARLHETSGAPVMFHHDDLQMYQHLDAQAKWLGVKPPPVTEVTDFVKEGDALECGAWKLQVMHTPGHSQGSISLYAPAEMEALTGNSALPCPSARGMPAADAASGLTPVLFAGDTLFAGSIGRTDLWGGSLDDIMRSLKGKVMALPDNTVVIPGHGPTTTIGEEREANPFLR